MRGTSTSRLRTIHLPGRLSRAAAEYGENSLASWRSRSTIASLNASPHQSPYRSVGQKLVQGQRKRQHWGSSLTSGPFSPNAARSLYQNLMFSTARRRCLRAPRPPSSFRKQDVVGLRIGRDTRDCSFSEASSKGWRCGETSAAIDLTTEKGVLHPMAESLREGAACRPDPAPLGVPLREGILMKPMTVSSQARPKRHHLT